jgi:ribosomal-protein-alanine N-acetyltransferase
MEIHLEKSLIRPWRAGDELSLVRHANNRNIWINLRDLFPYPYTMADARRWIAETAAQGEPHHWAVEVDGHAVGAVGLRGREDVNRISAEIGYWLGEEFWGRGIMTEVVGATTRHGFRELGFTRIFAEVFEWNAASMRVLEKNRYAREGVLRKSAIKAGQVIDQVVYAAISGAAAPRRA